MTGALAPRLRPLDEKVLAALDGGPVRAHVVAERLYGWAAWRCDVCGYTQRSVRRKPWRGMPVLTCGRIVDDECCEGKWRPFVHVADGELREVREVLRGLECIGRAREAGGWWRRGP